METWGILPEIETIPNAHQSVLHKDISSHRKTGKLFIPDIS